MEIVAVAEIYMAKKVLLDLYECILKCIYISFHSISPNNVLLSWCLNA